jgi:hypothetical protein
LARSAHRLGGSPAAARAGLTAVVLLFLNDALNGRGIPYSVHLFTRTELYHRATANELTAASAVHDMLAALRSERTALERVNTWPWQSETLRSVVVVLVLPLLLWFVQWLLGPLLGP